MLTKQEKISALREWFKKTKLDANVVNQTVGLSASSITPQLLLNTAAKVIKVNKHEIEPDDRDNLKYSKFLGIEDHIKEHVEKDAGKLQSKAKMKMDQKKNLDFLHAGFFTPQIKSVVVSNSLSQNLENINPLEWLDVSNKVTKMGEGGIKTTEQVPDESRQISPSSFGWVDALKIPESESMGVTGYFVQGLRKGDDNKLYRIMIDNQGKSKWVDHETVLNSSCKIPEV